MIGLGVSTTWLVGTAGTGINLVGGGGGWVGIGGGGGGRLGSGGCLKALGSKMPMGSTTCGPCPLNLCLGTLFFRCFSSLISFPIVESRSWATSAGAISIFVGESSNASFSSLGALMENQNF